MVAPANNNSAMLWRIFIMMLLSDVDPDEK